MGLDETPLEESRVYKKASWTAGLLFMLEGTC